MRRDYALLSVAQKEQYTMETLAAADKEREYEITKHTFALSPELDSRAMLPFGKTSWAQLVEPSDCSNNEGGHPILEVELGFRIDIRECEAVEAKFEEMALN